MVGGGPAQAKILGNGASKRSGQGRSVWNLTKI